MYPSKSNGNPSESDKPSETTKLMESSSGSDEKHGPPPDSNYQPPNPSAPMLPPSSPFNPAMYKSSEPPPYSSVVAEDSGEWKNRSSSFSGGYNPLPYTPDSSNLNNGKSMSGIPKQPPPPYPTDSATNKNYLSAGTLPQPPYPTGSGSAPDLNATAPYPAGQGTNSVITGQPSYTSGSGLIPGSQNQAPYPTGPTLMVVPTEVSQREIGFVAPVTLEPRSGEIDFEADKFGRLYLNEGSAVLRGADRQGTQDGLIYPKQVGEYIQQDVNTSNQYAQPQTIYVVEKNNERNNDLDDCASWMVCCYCFCETLNLFVECLRLCKDN